MQTNKIILQKKKRKKEKTVKMFFPYFLSFLFIDLISIKLLSVNPKLLLVKSNVGLKVKYDMSLLIRVTTLTVGK